MQYEFECECGKSVTKKVKPTKFEKLKENGVDCPDCGGTAEYFFEPGTIGVCFQGGGWRDKSLRERQYRQKRSKVMARRQKKNHKVPELKPNFEGQRTESWREAQAMAEKADGYFPETYDDRVEDES